MVEARPTTRVQAELVRLEPMRQQAQRWESLTQRDSTPLPYPPTAPSDEREEAVVVVVPAEQQTPAALLAAARAQAVVAVAAAVVVVAAPKVAVGEVAAAALLSLPGPAASRLSPRNSPPDEVELVALEETAETAEAAALLAVEEVASPTPEVVRRDERVALVALAETALAALVARRSACSTLAAHRRSRARHAHAGAEDSAEQAAATRRCHARLTAPQA